MLIGVSGKMRSGKDTVAEYIVEKYGFEHKKFSQGIKEIYEKYHYKDNNGIKPRAELQGLGQGIRAVLGEDVWVNYTLKDVEDNDNVIVSDVRQDNEFIALRERGAFIILVSASKQAQKERLLSLGESEKDNLDHETEYITESLADIEIVNDSTLEELYRKIDEVLSPLITGSKDLED